MKPGPSPYNPTPPHPPVSKLGAIRHAEANLQVPTLMGVNGGWFARPRPKCPNNFGEHCLWLHKKHGMWHMFIPEFFEVCDRFWPNFPTNSRKYVSNFSQNFIQFLCIFMRDWSLFICKHRIFHCIFAPYVTFRLWRKVVFFQSLITKSYEPHGNWCWRLKLMFLLLHLFPRKEKKTSKC